MPQPSTQDLQAPFDPTGYGAITGAQLLQLITGAYTGPDTGFIIVTQDAGSPAAPTVPDAITDTKWQKYIWLRQSANYVTAYIWNPGGANSATFQNWVTISQASIGAGSILGYMIASNTIPSTAIISITGAQITGSTPAVWLASLNTYLTALATDGLLTSSLFSNASFVWGDLQGSGSSPGAPVIKSLAISQAKLALQSVAGGETLATGQIIDRSITPTQLRSANPAAGLTDLNAGNSGVAAQTKNGVDPFNTISVPALSAVGFRLTTAQVIADTTAVAAGDVLAVNTGKTGFLTNRRAILTLAEPTSQTYPQVPIVAANGLVYSMANAQGAAGTGIPLGRILQQVFYTDNTPQTDTSGNVTCALNALPKQSATKNVVLLTGLVPALFTPLSPTSTIVVEACLMLANSNNNNNSVQSVIAALFQDATASAVAVGTSQSAFSGLVPVSIYFKLASSSGLASTGTTFSLGFTTTALNCYYNSIDGSTKSFGGTLGINSWCKITEYL
jgi:hypothetical protein